MVEKACFVYWLVIVDNRSNPISTEIKQVAQLLLRKLAFVTCHRQVLGIGTLRRNVQMRKTCR